MNSKKIIAWLLTFSTMLAAVPTAAAFSYNDLTKWGSIGGYEITTVAPEARHISLHASDSNGYQNINAVEFNPQNPYTELRAGLSAGYVYGVQTVNGTATAMSDESGQGDIAVAAINADYFTFGVGVPHGIFIEDGLILSTPPQYYAAFGLTNDNKPFIVRHGTILDKEFRIDGVLCNVTGINLPHAANANSLMLYTENYARTTKTGTTAYEVRCRVISGEPRHGETMKFVVESLHNAVGNTELGEGYIVLSATGAQIADLKKLTVGQELEMSFRFNEFWSNVKFAVGGIELLLKDGAVYSTSDTSRQPRTSVGIRADGTVVLATIDGRQDSAVGMSYKSAAEAMRALGCVDALNLDGGGSTTFVLRKPGAFSTAIVNKISGSSARQVANSLVLMNTAPTGAATSLALSPKTRLVMAGGSYHFAVDAAYDENVKPVKPSGSYIWSTDSDTNTIDESGMFNATEAGNVTVTALSGMASGTATAEIVSDITELIPSVTHITAAPGEAVTITATAKYNGRAVECPKLLFSWSAPEALGSFTSDGKFKISETARTGGEITVALGGKTAKIQVELTVPPVIIGEFETDAVQFVPVSVGTKVAPNRKFETDIDHVMFGARSLKMYYNFLNTTQSVGSYLMVSPDSADASALHIESLPKKLGMWVYGDGSGIALRTIIEDAAGKQHTLVYTGADGISWKGWKYVEVAVPQTIVAPIYIKVPVYLVSNPKKLTHGCLYFDRLRAVYSEPVGENHIAPHMVKAWPGEKGIISTRLPSVGIILRDDAATDIGAGIDPTTVELWINGYNCTDRVYDTVTGKISYTVKHALKNGYHTILVRARDYFGNPIVHEWEFEVRA